MVDAKINSFYKCDICGNVVSVINAGPGTLVCCGQDMRLEKEQTKESEGPVEKHVPVMEINGNEVKVMVGENPHPMEEEHYIVLIQLKSGDDVVMGKRLKPGDKPQAVFHVENPHSLKARAYCNIHGAWISE